MTDTRLIAECEQCGRRGEAQSRYMRYDAAADIWHQHVFCCGKCASAWIRIRESLPNTGIVVT